MKQWPRILGLTPGELTWLVVAVALLSYELWAVATRGGDVLTRAMRANLTRWTAIPVGWGILTAHLFGPVWAAFPYAWVIPFAVLGGFVARDVLIGGRVDVIAMMPLALLGLVLGVFWVGRP